MTDQSWAAGSSWLPSKSHRGSAPGAGGFAGIAGQVQLTGTHRLEVGGLAVAIEFGHHRCWPQATPLVKQEPQHRVGAQGFDMAGGIEVAVIAKEQVALGIDRFEHVAAIAAGGEAELGAHLLLEDLKEGAPVVATGAALGIKEQALQ